MSESGEEKRRARLINAMLERVDVDGLVGQVDLDELLARIDINELLDRVDVDRLLDRVAVNRLLDGVDVDRLLDGIDVNGKAPLFPGELKSHARQFIPVVVKLSNRNPKVPSHLFQRFERLGPHINNNTKETCKAVTLHEKTIDCPPCKVKAKMCAPLKHPLRLPERPPG